jgi:hypothetical protein
VHKNYDDGIVCLDGKFATLYDMEGACEAVLGA